MLYGGGEEAVVDERIPEAPAVCDGVVVGVPDLVWTSLPVAGEEMDAGGFAEQGFKGGGDLLFPGMFLRIVVQSQQRLFVPALDDAREAVSLRCDVDVLFDGVEGQEGSEVYLEIGGALERPLAGGTCPGRMGSA